MPERDGRRDAHELGVGELLRAFAAGERTPGGVLADLRRRWDLPADAAAGPAAGALTALVPGADEAADESDRRWREGTARALEGVPFAVKEIIDVAGALVTCGSALTRDALAGERVATADAEVVRRLREVGAVPVVMTATTEFACGAPHGVRGVVTNPWDPRRWTGGSSTGSAAALAARLVPLALGTDTGGSIRVPAALCGLTGLKPTYGLVPRTGVAPLSWSLDHVGPMARSAADLALVLGHLAGPDGVDPTAGPTRAAAALRAELAALTVERPERPSAPRPLAGLRVGLADGWFTDLCATGVLDAWRATAGVLEGLGAALVTLDTSGFDALHDDAATLLTCELAANQEARADAFALHDPGTQVRIARGAVPSAVDYLRAVRRRSCAQREVLAAWDAAGADLLLTPGVGGPAPLLDDLALDVDGDRHPLQAVISRTTAAVDLLGFPAVVLPAGSVVAGGRRLPVGVQLVGRPWADALCLRVAIAVQSVTDHHLAAPPQGPARGAGAGVGDHRR